MRDVRQFGHLVSFPPNPPNPPKEDKMTRKHYILLAQTIREMYDETTDSTEKATISQLTYKMCTTLKSDNWRFDREKFIKAAIGS